MQNRTFGNVDQLADIAWPWCLQQLSGLLRGYLGRVTPVFICEFLTQAAEQRQNILAPLPQLNSVLASLDASKPTVVYCAGGYRSSIGASRLVSAGFADVSDLLGGYGAWTAAHEAQPA